MHVALGTTVVLLLGFCLLGIAAACGASLLRLRGIVSFVLAVAVFVFAEIVAVSHALSLCLGRTRASGSSLPLAHLRSPPWSRSSSCGHRGLRSIVPEPSPATSLATQSSPPSPGSWCSNLAT